MKLLIGILTLLVLGCVDKSKVGKPCVIFTIPDESKDKAAQYVKDLVQTGRVPAHRAADMAEKMYGKQVRGTYIIDASGFCECVGPQ